MRPLSPTLFVALSVILSSTSVSVDEADIVFAYGLAGDIPIRGDWNGDGYDTPGVIRGDMWYLRNSNSDGPADVAFAYGLPGDLPVVGDWNNDGIDTPGVVRGDVWYVSNSFGGTGDLIFKYGVPGDQVVAGDWNGDGVDTPGVVRGDTWYLSNSFGGFGDLIFTYGLPGDIALVGDWNGDDIETPGVVRDATWYLSDSFGGTGDLIFVYGNPGDAPLTGDWDGNGSETPGVVRDAWWYLRNSFPGQDIPPAPAPVPFPPADPAFDEITQRYDPSTRTLQMHDGTVVQRQPLWSKFAPLVRLHPGEQHYPTRALGFFIRHSSFGWSNQSVADPPPLAGVGEVDARRLGAATLFSAYFWAGRYAWFHTRPFDPNRWNLRERDGFFLELGGRDADLTEQAILRRGCTGAINCVPDLADVPVYYEVHRSRPNGTTVITYWMFYAFNSAFGDYDHEGDWERVVVRLDANLQPFRVAYYQHSCAPRRVAWNSLTKVDDQGRPSAGGTHPIVYSARGTHASYARVDADLQRDNCAVPVIPVRDHVCCNDGRSPEWRTWTLGANVRRQPWYGYGGAWGEVGESTNTTGPLGPSWYKRPAPDGW